MRMPSGLGGWIAFRGRIGTAKQAAALAVEMGCSWVAPRAGDGSLNDSAFKNPAAEIDAYHQAGLLVFPWLYSRRATWRTQVLAVAQLQKAGADGYIDDAEIAWAGGQADCETYGRALRAVVGPEFFLADAPWPWVYSHSEYPEKEFAGWVDARMPQDYWCEINRSGARAVVGEQEKQWARRFADPGRTPEERDPIWPVANTYGRAELIAAGAPACPGDMVPDDLDWFLDAHPNVPVSLYSLEMLTVDTPNARELRRRLAARAERSRPPTPEVRRADGDDPAPMATAAQTAGSQGSS